MVHQSLIGILFRFGFVVAAHVCGKQEKLFRFSFSLFTQQKPNKEHTRHITLYNGIVNSDVEQMQMKDTKDDLIIIIIIINELS